MSEITLDKILSKQFTGRKEIVNVDETMLKLVIFALGNDWFAFSGKQVREILACADIFFVPGCPPSLEGVINVRGDIESVIRLNELLQLPLPEPGKPAEILLSRSSAMNSGIRVDQVIDVIDLPESLIQAPPANLPETLRPFVSGIFSFNQKIVTVLDLEQIFLEYARGLG